MRKVFLDELPIQKEYNVKRIDWKNCIGYKVPFIYDDIEGEVEIVEYKPKGQILTIKWLREFELNISTGNFLKCKIGKMLNRYTIDFKIEIGTSLKDGSKDLIITDREYRNREQKPDKKGRIYLTNEKWYKYTCNKCGWTEGWIVEGALLQSQGCSCCSGRTAVLGINTIWDTDRDWIEKYGVSEEDAKRYTSQSNKKIEVTCPDCGKKKNIIISQIYSKKSISCNCGDGFSYPEKFITKVLIGLELNFQTQYSPIYLRGKRSDFYLPEYNLVIETDGALGHKGGRTHSKSKLSIEELIEIDKWKDEQHKLHSVETIRINCFESDMEYIKENILNSKLNELFDLSNVDWMKCEEFALKNIVKEVCEYWNQKEEWETTGTIAKNNEWGIKSIFTIASYLKIGTKHDWCYYNPKIEKSKVSSRAGKSYSKPVKVFKDGVSLGAFESIAELSRQSEEKFNVKLDYRNISAVCLGKQRSYKGFEFKFVNVDDDLSFTEIEEAIHSKMNIIDKKLG